MATIGNLWINIKSNTEGLEKGVKKSKKTLGGFKGVLAGIGVAMAAAFAIKIIKDFTGAIFDAMDRIDEVAKFAKTIGVGTEAVLVFRHAAKLTGLTVGEADKAFGKMVKNVGEVTMGIGTATDAFKVLGLDTQKIGNMQADDMFGVIADSIMEIDNVAQQASIAYDIFGRAGMKLLNTMKMGSEGIKEMKEEMRDMGVLFSSFDAAGVERANDAMTTLGMVVDSIFEKLAIDLAPAIEEIANILTELASSGEMQEFVRSMGDMGAKTVSGASAAIKKHNENVDTMSIQMARLSLFFTGEFSAAFAEFPEHAKAFSDIGTAAEQAAEKTRVLADEAAALAAAEAITKEVTELEGLVEKFTMLDPVSAFNAELRKLDETYRRLGGAIKEGTIDAEAGEFAIIQISKEMDRIAKEKFDFLNAEKVDEDAKKIAENLRAMGESLTQSLRTPQEIYRDELAKTDEMLAGSVITQETYNRAIEKLRDDLEKSMDIEVNVMAKGFVEGLQTAMGTVKVAGQVSRTDQIAEKSLRVAENMETLTNAISSSISDSATSSGVTASKAGGILSKLGNMSVGISWSGLSSHITTGVENATLNIPSQSMDYTEHLLEEVRAANWQELTELKTQTAIMSGGGGTPLT